MQKFLLNLLTIYISKTDLHQTKVKAQSNYTFVSYKLSHLLDIIEARTFECCSSLWLISTAVSWIQFIKSAHFWNYSTLVIK